MHVHRPPAPLAVLSAAILIAFATIQCRGTGSPAQPTPAISGVVLNSTAVSAGNTLQGTVTLTAAVSTESASIVLSSSDTSVATVQTPVMIPPGASSTTFTVTARAAGKATITASFNGTGQSPALTVTGPSAVAITLASLSLSASSVIGGNPVTGKATLSGPAPAGGAEVLLLGNAPVSLSTILDIPAGSTSATFIVSTRAVLVSTLSPINGTYGGASATVVLAVEPADQGEAIADFGITGSSITDTCHLIDNGQHLDCAFDGSASTAPGTIVAWEWSYTVATTISQTTLGPRLTAPIATCALVPAPPLATDSTSFKMTVRLKIRDSLGNVSAEAVASDIRLLPQGACGF